MQYLVAKQIADKFKQELGFVNRTSLKVQEDKEELIVLDDIGFISFHLRRDNRATIYNLAVNKDYQKQGYGRLLIYKLICLCIENNKRYIQCKCPEDLVANSFYEHLEFKLIDVEQGKKRKLNVWRYEIKLPLLFYCADGGRNKFSSIAKQLNYQLGFKSNESNPNNSVAFIDNDWKKYNHNKHLETIKKYKPMLATIKDLETVEDYQYIKDNIAEFSKYCGRLLIIPKLEIDLDITEDFWIAFSVPSRYGKTTVSNEYFKQLNKPIHLLGGSPKKQYKYANELNNVVSLDGNYMMLSSKYGSICSVDKSEYKDNLGMYNSFEQSLINIKQFYDNSLDLKYKGGRPKAVNSRSYTVSFKCTKNVHDYLNSLDNTSNYINNIVEELLLTVKT